MKKIYTLGIDTSCDDTSVAVLENDKVLSSVVSSQIDIHKEWGGVVPSLAGREHEKMIKECTSLALKRSGVKDISKIDVIAVTYGPGLAPALDVGIQWARELAINEGVPLVAVNHMEGHTLSVFLKNSKGKNYAGVKTQKFPFLALCVSGGHTELLFVEGLGAYEILGQTLDDAAGEAFDKVARMLGLGYPGGPVIARLAEEGDPTAYQLPRPMIHTKDYNFSFSGLKTASLYGTNELKKTLGKKFPSIIPDYCASFQEAVVDTLVKKTIRAAEEKKPKMIVLGGGVAANKRLRTKLRYEAKSLGIPVYFPYRSFSTDNAAMIALAGYYKFQRGELADPKTLERKPGLVLGKE